MTANIVIEFKYEIVNQIFIKVYEIFNIRLKHQIEQVIFLIHSLSIFSVRQPNGELCHSGHLKIGVKGLSILPSSKVF